ncbi:hypothetical protein HZ326_22390 [Fusarium oxysporum f. sp. albedinis]|nr:hypothetical protein HZ326_22390 [Fusarium oxysporum f. sp. albedinis]
MNPFRVAAVNCVLICNAVQSTEKIGVILSSSFKQALFSHLGRPHLGFGIGTSDPSHYNHLLRTKLACPRLQGCRR